MTESSWGNICAEAAVPVDDAPLRDELVDGVGLDGALEPGGHLVEVCASSNTGTHILRYRKLTQFQDSQDGLGRTTGRSFSTAFSTARSADCLPPLGTEEPRGGIVINNLLCGESVLREEIFDGFGHEDAIEPGGQLIEIRASSDSGMRIVGYRNPTQFQQPQDGFGLTFGLTSSKDFLPVFGTEERGIHGHQLPPGLSGRAFAQSECGEFGKDHAIGFIDTAQCGGQRAHYVTDDGIVGGVRDCRERRQRNIFDGCLQVHHCGNIVRAEYQWVNGETGPLRWADGEWPTGPGGRGSILADDQQHGVKPVFGVQMRQVVRPGTWFLLVVVPLSFDEQQESSFRSFYAEQGIDAALQWFDLREIGRQQRDIDRIGKRQAQITDRAGEYARILPKEVMHRLVLGADHARDRTGNYRKYVRYCEIGPESPE